MKDRMQLPILLRQLQLVCHLAYPLLYCEWT
jgi:hypothetical protein